MHVHLVIAEFHKALCILLANGTVLYLQCIKIKQSCIKSNLLQFVGFRVAHSTLPGSDILYVHVAAYLFNLFNKCLTCK